jgi:hypothetical protein
LAHFVSELTDADGEQAETQHWIDTALYGPLTAGKMHQKSVPAEVLSSRLNAPYTALRSLALCPVSCVLCTPSAAN